ncbi:MAG: hypothetical protein FK734_17230 [Asgard group archaeon]|nr:hypothetical protein [Asgard group archaeon]
MNDMDILYIVMLATFFVIFGVFLFFDLFKRNEKYAYLAYLVVLLPINYLWYLTSISDSIFSEITSLTVFLIWIILLDVCLLRDLIFVYRKSKEFDDILLFLLFGLFVQLIISAIIPNSVDELQLDTAELWVFYLPDVHDSNINSSGIQVGFQAAATFMVLLAIIPLILDIKDEEISLPVNVIISTIFYLPFLYLAYIWLPSVAMFAIAFIMSVVLFILLLIITKSS